MTADLFDGFEDAGPAREPLAPGAALLRGFARRHETELITAIEAIAAQAPFRRMVTPGGHQMSVAMTSCGSFGWVTDRSGYRYDALDPDSGQPWPAMPPRFRELAERAAGEVGFAGFAPDACLINRYEPGAKMSLHQDRDERDIGAPIVSVSLGLPATFLFGGLNAPTRRSATVWRTAMSSCGAARRDSPFTASRRSPTASTRCSAASVST